MSFSQNKRLRIQLGAHVVLRRGYWALPSIHPHPTCLYRAQKSAPPASSPGIRNLHAHSCTISTSPRDRVYFGNLPRCPRRRSEDARAKRGCDICVQACTCNFGGVGACCREGRGGFREGKGKDASLRVCEGGSGGCYAVVEYQALGKNVNDRYVLTGPYGCLSMFSDSNWCSPVYHP